MFANAIRRASSVDLAAARLRVIGVGDLVRSKMRSAVEPKRRRSKRLRDLADIQQLSEDHLDIAQAVSAEERSALHALLPDLRL